MLEQGVEDLPDWGSARGLSGCASFTPGKPIRGGVPILLALVRPARAGARVSRPWFWAHRAADGGRRRSAASRAPGTSTRSRTERSAPRQGPVVIGSEVDRVYLATTCDCTIDEAGLGRRFRIAKQGSRSTVVWNPWEAQAAKMGDFGPEGYLGMVCVESGNALEDVVPVAAGAEHTLTVRYSVERLAA